MGASNGTLANSIAPDSDNGDSFSANLLSDLGPLLSLFGEQVAKQFMSESLGWSDNILFAMAPLGIITAIVGAIRVGGPRWLMAIIGRIRENRAMAEVELMSSTSHEVCEMWNGLQLVRIPGSPPIRELIHIRPPQDTDIKPPDGSESPQAASTTGTGPAIPEPKNQHHPADMLYTLSEPGIRTHLGNDDAMESQMEVEELGNSDSTPELQTPRDEEKTTPPPPKRAKDHESSGPISAPNISLNTHNRASRRELHVFACIGVILQFGLLVYDGFATYTLKFAKGGSLVAVYAFPITCAGTITLVVGMLLCSYVIEASTVESRYRTKVPESEVHMVWLQKAAAVNDQVFDSYAIFANGKRSLITTSRRKVRGGKNSSEDENSTWDEVVTTFAVLISLLGFISQFIGLRSMHWSASFAQLGATLVMTAARAWVRRGLATPPYTQLLPSDFELDWLATRTSDDESLGILWTEPSAQPNAEEPSRKRWEQAFRVFFNLSRSITANESPTPPAGFWSPACLGWGVMTGQFIDEFSDLNDRYSRGSAQVTLETRIRLGKLTQWPGPAVKEAISVAAAIELVMETLYRGGSDGDILAWCMHSYGNQAIRFEITRKQGKWRANVAEIESALSLRLYSVHERELRVSLEPGIEDDSGWLRSGVATTKKGLQLLGPSTEVSRRDMRWWLGSGITEVLEVGAPHAHNTENAIKADAKVTVESHRVVGSGGWTATNRQTPELIRLYETRVILPKHSEPVVVSGNPLLKDLVSRPWPESEQIGRLFDFPGPIASGEDLPPGSLIESWPKYESRRACPTPPTPGDTDAVPGTINQAWARYGTRRVCTHLIELVATDLGAIRPTSKLSDSDTDEAPQLIDWDLDTNKKAQLVEDSDSDEAPQLIPYESDTDEAPQLIQHESDTDEPPQLIPKEPDAHGPQPINNSSTGSAPQPAKASPGTTPGSPTPPEISAVETSALALKSYLPLSQLYALDMFSAFLCSLGPKLNPIVGSKAPGTGGIMWNSFNLESPVLSSLAQGIQSTGLCGLEESYMTLIPPLSWHMKLDASIVINLASEQAIIYELAENWKEAAECLFWALRISLNFASQETPGANAIAAILEFLSRLANTAYFRRENKVGTLPYSHLFRLHNHLVESLIKTVRRPVLGSFAALYMLQGRAPTAYDDMIYHWWPADFLSECGEASTLILGRTKLHELVATSDDPVQYLLEEGDLGAADALGWTVAHYASVSDNNELRTMFLVDKTLLCQDIAGWTPLHYQAIRRVDFDGDPLGGFQGHPPHTISAAITTKGKDGLTPLHCAAASGNLEMVDSLIKLGADFNAQDNRKMTPLHWAVFNGHYEVVRYLLLENASLHICDEFRRTPLHHAALGRPNSARILELLLLSDPDKDLKDFMGSTPLHIAAEAGDAVLVKALLDAGANFKIEDQSNSTPVVNALHGHGHRNAAYRLLKDREDSMKALTPEQRILLPLHIAVLRGSPTQVDELIKSGADLSATLEQDYEQLTALHLCASKPSLATLDRLLKDIGDNLNTKTTSGDTALHYAVKANLIQNVEALLKAGIDPDLKNTDGETALGLAVMYEYPEIIQIIKAAKSSRLD